MVTFAGDSVTHFNNLGSRVVKWYYSNLGTEMAVLELGSEYQ